MKRFGWILVLLTLATPAWAAKKISVQQLRDMLVSLAQAKKADADVATALKQVELTEELTQATMNSLTDYIPGPYTTEQIFVLEACSATLAPTAADLPATPAPDAATQKAILGKALDYASKNYAQLPQLTATKITVRFQDNITATAPSSGLQNGAVGSAQDAARLALDGQFVHYINTTENQVTLQNGAEQNPLAKDKTLWGRNGYIALLGQSPVLSTVLQEAGGAADKINWLRWESINGRAAAVYTFSVDKKKSRYAVNYCCFPNVESAGRIGGLAGGVGGSNANFQTATDWKNYKATVPYHGEIFVDPATGIVVRLITIAEFKSSEEVRQEDQRIDYGPVTVGTKMLVLPVKTFVNTVVVPNGDSGTAGAYSNRHTLFTAEYKNYQPAGGGK
jgi:hypothetical protein